MQQTTFKHLKFYYSNTLRLNKNNAQNQVSVNESRINQEGLKKSCRFLYLDAYSRSFYAF
jgi:hypothetical protein